jgi:hypothetical protein
MAYRVIRRRVRRRPEVDPETGLTKALLKRTLGYDDDPRKCPTVGYLLDRDEENAGGFDLAGWAEENDLTCHPNNGGTANPRSLAARTGLSEWTVVNSVLPLPIFHVHRVGPVTITTAQSFDAGYRCYQACDGRRFGGPIVKPFRVRG